MNTYVKFPQLCQLHALIKRNGTGNSRQLAQKLNVSTRSVYNLLDHLRTLGAQINYCRERKTYYYSNDFDFQLIITSNGKQQVYKGGFFMAK